MQRFLGALTGLQLLPARRHGFAVSALGVAEDVRVTALQLVADGGAHLIEIEQPLFLPHLSVEHHLKQQVAQLVAQIGVVLPLDGVQHFVSFFQRIRRNGGEGLLAVPRAADLRSRSVFMMFSRRCSGVDWVIKNL